MTTVNDPGAREADEHCVHVATRDEIEPGSHLLTLVEGREVAIYNVDGAFHALANYCPHQGGPVCEGTQTGLLVKNDEGEWCREREGGIVACPWHGWEFDVATGESVTGSAYRVPSYDVAVDGDDVYVVVR